MQAWFTAELTRQGSDIGALRGNGGNAVARTRPRQLPRKEDPYSDFDAALVRLAAAGTARGVQTLWGGGGGGGGGVRGRRGGGGGGGARVQAGAAGRA